MFNIKNEKLINNDAIEEILNNLRDNIQIIIEYNAITGDRIINIPAEVATPLPPLKFSHIGYTCPIKTKNKQ